MNTYYCTDCGKEFEPEYEQKDYTWPPCPDCRSTRTEPLQEREAGRLEGERYKKAGR